MNSYILPNGSIWNFTSLKLLLLKFVPIRLGLMDNQGSNKLTLLLGRLSEAERRAKLLKLEVRSIRQELATLKSTVTVPVNNSTVAITEVSNRRLSPRIIQLNGPSTSRTVVDAPTSSRNIANENKRLKASFDKENDYVVVYTDGACENNGKPNAKAGIGVWFGDNHPLNISKPIQGKATNNAAEIQACIEALLAVKEQGITKVKLYTDSQFTISCMTEWIKNWKKNNWRTASGGPVKNKQDLQKLDETIKSFVDVKWSHVAGHQGIRGNEEADKLAREGAQQYRC